MSENKPKIGRPTLYNADISNEICHAVSTTSTSLRKLCELNSHWPNRETIYSWLYHHAEFTNQYAHAKDRQVEILIDEITDISDDSTHDTIIKTNKKGDKFKAQNSEWVNRSRLKIDARFRLAELLKPKKYSNKYVDKSDVQNLVKAVIEKL